MLAEMFCSLKAIEAAQSHHLSDRMSRGVLNAIAKLDSPVRKTFRKAICIA